MSERDRKKQPGGPGKTKIAILGGGLAGISAALYLSHPNNPRRDEFDITVYQSGWRLGGKCASGRNLREHGRIEEHGLHVLLGFYENAFRMFRQTMAEWKIRPGHPWWAENPEKRWRKAFAPAHYAPVVEPRPDGSWEQWHLCFPELDGEPGDNSPPRDDLVDFLDTAIAWLKKMLKMLELEVPADQCLRDWFGDQHQGQHARKQAARRRSHRRAGVLTAIPIALKVAWLGVRLYFTLGILGWRRKFRKLQPARQSQAQMLRVMIDLLSAAVWGLIRNSHQIYFRTLDAIDRYDLREFLSKYGADKASIESPLVDTLYDSLFSTVSGTSRRSDENLAAGAAIRSFACITLGYKGAPWWKMHAGMGDTIFTPAYEVLRQRRVRFNFFHRITNLGLSPDGSRIDRIAIDVQSQIVNSETRERVEHAEYDPLVEVEYLNESGTPYPEKLRCWPSEPDFSQLENGDQLKAAGIDLEAFGSVTKSETIELTYGDDANADFHHVLFAISIGAIQHVAPELVAANPKIARTIERVQHIQTQSYQVWLNKDLKGLGWKREPPVLGNFVDPMNAWADMSHLIPAESVLGVRNIAYFTGAMRDDETLSDVKSNSIRLLDAMAQHLLPEAGNPNQSGEFDRRLILGEYHRSNTNPSDRYVLNVAGTTEDRLPVGGSGFSNLTLAGDWTRNGFNVGAAEPTVMSGMQASNHISGFPALSDIVRNFGP